MQNFDFGQGGNMVVLATLIAALVQSHSSVHIAPDDVLALFGLVGGAVSWFITLRDKQLSVAGFHAVNPG